jgi:hypothetical protein
MTEQEWLTSRDFLKLAFFVEVEKQGSQRKLRLLTCALCRAVRQAFEDSSAPRAVEVSERYADGLASEDELKFAREVALETFGRLHAEEHPPGMIRSCTFCFKGRAEAAASMCAGHVASVVAIGNNLFKASLGLPSDRGLLGELVGFGFGVLKAVVLRQHPTPRDRKGWPFMGIFHEIFGNPFCPPSLDGGWLNETVVSLAQAIYGQRAFDQMPILGDAMEEAGCSDATMLNHCRQSGEHFRGCWVVDSLLGKT